MDAVVELIVGVGLVALMGGALATILRLQGARDRLLRLGAGMLLAALLVPVALGQIATRIPAIPSGGHLTHDFLGALAVLGVVLGHAALGAVLVRRSLRRRDGAQHGREALERARLRGRPRLPPSVEQQP